MNKLALIAILALSLTACSNASDATKALTAQGFTDIQTTGYAGPFACSNFNGAGAGAYFPDAAFFARSSFSSFLP